MWSCFEAEYRLTATFLQQPDSYCYASILKNFFISKIKAECKVLYGSSENSLRKQTGCDIIFRKVMNWYEKVKAVSQSLLEEWYKTRRRIREIWRDKIFQILVSHVNLLYQCEPKASQIRNWSFECQNLLWRQSKSPEHLCSTMDVTSFPNLIEQFRSAYVCLPLSSCAFQQPKHS
jgi:hypothetical protein